MKLLAITTVVIASCVLAKADTIVFATPPGSTTAGGAVSAEATFVTGPGTVSITLSNLLANPTDVAQLLSDLAFVLSNGATTGTIASSSGQELTVNSNGTFSLGSMVATGWALNALGAGLQLNVLGTAIGPAHLVIGPPDGSNLYSNANGSIAGNAAHNPFLDQSITFTLDIPGVTDTTTITSATFSFGTTAGANEVPGTPIPEPTTLVLFGGGLIGLSALIRRRLHI